MKELSSLHIHSNSWYQKGVVFGCFKSMTIGHCTSRFLCINVGKYLVNLFIIQKNMPKVCILKKTTFSIYAAYYFSVSCVSLMGEKSPGLLSAGLLSWSGTLVLHFNLRPNTASSAYPPHMLTCSLNTQQLCKHTYSTQLPFHIGDALFTAQTQFK